MNKKSTDSRPKPGGAGVWMYLDKEWNDRLTRSAIENNRSKREEAKYRLMQSLRQS